MSGKGNKNLVLIGGAAVLAWLYFSQKTQATDTGGGLFGGGGTSADFRQTQPLATTTDTVPAETGTITPFTLNFASPFPATPSNIFTSSGGQTTDTGYKPTPNPPATSSKKETTVSELNNFAATPGYVNYSSSGGQPASPLVQSLNSPIFGGNVPASLQTQYSNAVGLQSFNDLFATAKQTALDVKKQQAIANAPLVDSPASWKLTNVGLTGVTSGGNISDYTKKANTAAAAPADPAATRVISTIAANLNTTPLNAARIASTQQLYMPSVYLR